MVQYEGSFGSDIPLVAHGKINRDQISVCRTFIAQNGILEVKVGSIAHKNGTYGCIIQPVCIVELFLCIDDGLKCFQSANGTAVRLCNRHSSVLAGSDSGYQYIVAQLHSVYIEAHLERPGRHHAQVIERHEDVDRLIEVGIDLGRGNVGRQHPEVGSWCCDDDLP